jgi:hypothetical protein
MPLHVLQVTIVGYNVHATTASNHKSSCIFHIVNSPLICYTTDSLLAVVNNIELLSARLTSIRTMRS